MELLSSLRESTVPRTSCKTGNDTCCVGLSLLSGRASNTGGVGSANTVAGGNGAAGSDGAGCESEPANDKGGGTASASGCAEESSSCVAAVPSSCNLASTALSPAAPPTSAGAPVVRPSRQAASCSVCTAPGKPFCGTLSASTLISESTASSLPSSTLSSSILRMRLFAPSSCSSFSSEDMESPRRKAVVAAAAAPTKCSAAGGSARCGGSAAGASSAASAAWPTLGSMSSEDSAAGRKPSPPPLPQPSPAEVSASPCASCCTSESGSCFNLCASSSGTSDGMVAHDTGKPTAGMVSW
mmetsp:Transcript_82725/g.210445  ORF Transcript_82725/g.210445 Transcript_82725/m.210445 type:complete len:298 (-) Transcript_82725:1251-2144(-)